MSVLLATDEIRERAMAALHEVVPEEESVLLSVVPSMAAFSHDDDEEDETSLTFSPWVTVHLALLVPEAEAHITTHFQVAVRDALNAPEEFAQILHSRWTDMHSKRLLLAMEPALERVLHEEID